MSESENKSIGRRENRAAAMQFVYMRDANKEMPFEKAVEAFFEVKEEPRTCFAFAEELIAGIEANIIEIDEAISKSTRNWTMDRIAKVDLAILRLAVFELLFLQDL